MVTKEILRKRLDLIDRKIEFTENKIKFETEEELNEKQKSKSLLFQLWHGDNKVEIKTDKWSEIVDFVKLHKKGVTGFNQGYKKVPESKLQHCIDNVSIEDLMTLKEGR